MTQKMQNRCSVPSMQGRRLCPVQHDPVNGAALHGPAQGGSGSLWNPEAPLLVTSRAIVLHLQGKWPHPWTTQLQLLLATGGLSALSRAPGQGAEGWEDRDRQKTLPSECRGLAGVLHVPMKVALPRERPQPSPFVKAHTARPELCTAAAALNWHHRVNCGPIGKDKGKRDGGQQYCISPTSSVVPST